MWCRLIKSIVKSILIDKICLSINDKILNLIFLSTFLVHWIIVQFTVKGELVCSEIYQSCDIADCHSYCQYFYSKSLYGQICDDFNLCTCFFHQDSSSPNICNVGLGECIPGKCGQSCCNAKCASKFKQGVGFCLPSPRTRGRCVCSYRSWKLLY
jgi:hypothetical protein